ncbi:MAG: transcriptional regulator [Blastopirellula sp.]|nr:MAG: transcriptional regulator [Blastopirellula sp.]
MPTENISVNLQGDLHSHLQQQIGENGLYENASEYIRSLIRKDLKNQTESWQWLSQELEAGLRADESDFVPVSAQDVIHRNQGN